MDPHGNRQRAERVELEFFHKVSPLPDGMHDKLTAAKNALLAGAAGELTEMEIRTALEQEFERLTKGA